MGTCESTYYYILSKRVYEKSRQSILFIRVSIPASQEESKICKTRKALRLLLLGNQVHLILTLRFDGEALGFPRNFQVNHELMKL